MRQRIVRIGKNAVGAVRSDLEILGYRVSGAGLEKDVATVHGWIESGVHGRYFACLNPHSVAVASRDPLFRESLRSADMLVADGSGVLLAA
ncbi:MAG: hypothetical protein WAV26_06065, partial [Candidatus Deferrimicrobium sp.]